MFTVCINIIKQMHTKSPSRTGAENNPSLSLNSNIIVDNVRGNDIAFIGLGGIGFGSTLTPATTS